LLRLLRFCLRPPAYRRAGRAAGGFSSSIAAVGTLATGSGNGTLPDVGQRNVAVT
jgi:hypothetical protein